MKLTTRQVRIFQWVRMAMLGMMGLGGVVAGFNFSFLPTVTPQIGGATAAIAGAIATWAGSVISSQTTEESLAKAAKMIRDWQGAVSEDKKFTIKEG